MKKEKKQAKPYDDAFKLLAEQDAEALLLLLGEIKPGEKVRITPVGPELRAATRLPDQAYIVVTAAGARIVHIEAQTRYELLMPDRMAGYGVLEWMQYHLPVTCYLLLLTDRGLPERPPTVGRIDAGDVRITVRYRNVRLSQISAARVLELKRNNLLPFVPLMQGGEEELEAGARMLGQIENEQDQLKLGLGFLTLGGLRYNPEDLLDLVGRESMIPLRILRESPTYEFLINEGKDRWKAEGIEEGLRKGLRRGIQKGLQKGRQKGLQEGQVQALSELLRLMIARQFPRLRVAQKIMRIHDPALLRQLVLEATEIQDAAALHKRLNEAIKSQNPQ